jgi:hypothetical protein
VARECTPESIATHCVATLTNEFIWRYKMENNKSETFYKKKAYQHFGLVFGNSNGFVLHHKDSSLKKENPKRYKEWRIEDLVVMTSSEHAKLHNTGKIISKETIDKRRKNKIEEEKKILANVKRTNTFTIFEIAKIYNISPRMARYYIKNNKIPYKKIDRTRKYIKIDKKEVK